MSEPLFDLRAIEVAYGDRAVLSVDRLTISEHEALVIVGPNGAGKSTLLRLLNFLEPPDRGEIRFHGRLVPYPAPLDLRRGVTTVFQRPALLNRSVFENIAYGLRLRRRETLLLTRKLVERLALHDLERAPAANLSGGEAQRVALARALALEPEVLLLDEPTANLDPYNMGLVEGLIQELRTERRCTLIVVTHNVFQARRLADRVAMLHEGRLIEVAGAAQFFASPRDPRAAAFVRGELVA
ncbi:MAG TPA: ATP-binding cassette domain-containing protein [Anaerolineales bacterium]|nr:ATP-binding cassette domain-containing protein [Anaerolineales bacterium]